MTRDKSRGIYPQNTWKVPVLAARPWTDYADVLAGLRVIVEGP